MVRVAPSRLDLADIHIQPHSAETYDDLHSRDTDPEQE